MKEVFRVQGSSIVLKSYDQSLSVYPGMQVGLKDKKYIVEQAILSLDTDEVTVVVKRNNKEEWI